MKGQRYIDSRFTGMKKNNDKELDSSEMEHLNTKGALLLCPGIDWVQKVLPDPPEIAVWEVLLPPLLLLPTWAPGLLLVQLFGFFWVLTVLTIKTVAGTVL